MLITPTPLPDLLIIQPKIFEDTRGYFFESYNEAVFSEHGLTMRFVQDNLSKSKKNTLRGLHFQKYPFQQGKLVSVIKGSVRDVVVDIRRKSPMFGKSFSIDLTELNKTMLWIPPGFAHGFLTMEDDSIFSYKCTNFYNKESESGILWNDKQINIQWNCENPVLSEKDKILPTWKEILGLF